MIFQKHRFQIWSASQHPYKHDLDEFIYANPSLPGVTSVGAALNWIVAVLYPQSKPAVATPAALPMVGNTINDMRVVSDDGDGKAATYRWEQREGDVAPQWYKIYDLDWGTDSILQGFLTKTQDIYVKRLGYDDTDASGAAIIGDLAGQSIYGGATANTNLTLFANSGDGTGPATGFVQLGDNVRPLTDSVFSLGTTSHRFLKGWFDELEIGTTNIVAGVITDSSGSISFGDENLSTTGTVTVGSLVLSSALITDTSGSISFDNENLTTTGTMSATSMSATGAPSTFAAGTTIADFTFTDGNIDCTTGFIDFNALELISTGPVTFGQLTVDSVRINNDVISTLSGNNLYLSPSTTGNVYATKHFITQNVPLTCLGATFSVTDGEAIISGTGARLTVDNIRLDGLTLSTTSGDLTVAPFTALTLFASALHPTTDNARNLGASGARWQHVWFGGNLENGTHTIVNSELFSLRSTNFRDAARTLPVQAGDTLFWNGSQWLASAPDTEIDHGSISGLGDDDHSQYLLLAGRAGGQSIVGGTAASNNLDLESTSNATKGFIQVKDSLRAFTDASYTVSWAGTDLGGSGNRFRHVYTAGEFYGFRVQNVGVLPSNSVQNIGRLVFLTTTNVLYVDTGTTWKQVGANAYYEDTVWSGAETSKVVTVSGLDARFSLWQLMDNSNNFNRIYCSIQATSATSVTITVGSALPAGSYRLKGIE